jgi:hypothetical protein
MTAAKYFWSGSSNVASISTWTPTIRAASRWLSAETKHAAIDTLEEANAAGFAVCVTGNVLVREIQRGQQQQFGFP